MLKQNCFSVLVMLVVISSCNQTVREYYTDGFMKSECEKFYFKKQNRICTLWYPNGVKEAEIHYIDSILHGKFTSWYTNGNLQMIGYYDRGKKDGVYERFDSNGNKIKDGHFFSDKPNGTWIGYYDDGSIKEKYNYEKGILDGIVEGYYNNGKIKIKGQYENDLKVGEWIEWAEDGTELFKKIYNEGRLVDSISYSGNISNGSVTQ